MKIWILVERERKTRLHPHPPKINNFGRERKGGSLSLSQLSLQPSPVLVVHVDGSGSYHFGIKQRGSKRRRVGLSEPRIN